MHFLGEIITLLAIVAFAIAQTGPEIAAYFKDHLSSSSEVYLPSQSNFTEETTQRWNAFSAPTYVVSVKPGSDEDVQKVVSLLPGTTIPACKVLMIRY